MTEFTDDNGNHEHLYTGFEKIKFNPNKNYFNKHPDVFIISDPGYQTYKMEPITISGELYIPSYMSNSYKKYKIKNIDPSGVFFADLSNVTDVKEDETIINEIKNGVIKSNNIYTKVSDDKNIDDNTFPFHKRYKKVNSYNPTEIKPNDVNTIGNLILKLIELNEKGIDLELLDGNEYSKIPLFGRYNETKEIYDMIFIYRYLKKNEKYSTHNSLTDLFKIFEEVFPTSNISEENISEEPFKPNEENFPDIIFRFSPNENIEHQEKKFEELKQKNDELKQKTKILKKKIEELLKKNEQQPEQQLKLPSTPDGKDIPFKVSFDSNAKIVKVEINNKTFGDGTYIVNPKDPNNKPETSGGEKVNKNDTIDKIYSFVYNTGDKSIKYDQSKSTPKPLLLRPRPQPPITEQTNDMKNILNEYLKLFDVLEKRYTDIDTATQNDKDVETVEDFSLVSHKINQVVFEDIPNETKVVKQLKKKYPNNQQEQTTTQPPPLPQPLPLPLPPRPPQQDQINDLKGIVNIGNSCYINATIQFLMNAGVSAINAANYNTVLHNFMKGYKNNEEDPIKTGVYNLAGVFGHNGSQQDASESVLIPFLNKKGEGFDTTVRITSTFNCNDDEKYNYSKSDVSNTILVLPINEDPTNLTTLIQSMSESVELDVPTDTCQQKVPDINIKTTKTDHYYFGDYAIIALNRFIVNQSDNTTSKNDSKVSIEKKLTLPINEQSTHEYKCISMINHSGSLNAGHYWANVVKYDKSDKPQMYKCNDSSITEESIPNDEYIVENSPYVYIVLYEKIKDPRVGS
jgi:ubiquitin C-terminal hydrolase